MNRYHSSLMFFTVARRLISFYNSQNIIVQNIDRGRLTGISTEVGLLE